MNRTQKHGERARELLVKAQDLWEPMGAGPHAERYRHKGWRNWGQVLRRNGPRYPEYRSSLLARCLALATCMGRAKPRRKKHHPKEVIPMAQAYCVKCRASREIRNPAEVTLKNGRPATQGTCTVCGIKVSRLIKAT